MRMWRKLRRTWLFKRLALACEPLVWRKAKKLYIRQYQKNLKAVAAILSQQLKDEVMVTFDSTRKQALLYRDEEVLAYVAATDAHGSKKATAITVHTDLYSCHAFFQLCFLGLDVRLVPLDQTLLLT